MWGLIQIVVCKSEFHLDCYSPHMHMWSWGKYWPLNTTMFLLLGRKEPDWERATVSRRGEWPPGPAEDQQGLLQHGGGGQGRRAQGLVPLSHVVAGQHLRPSWLHGAPSAGGEAPEDPGHPLPGGRRRHGSWLRPGGRGRLPLPQARGVEDAGLQTEMGRRPIRRAAEDLHGTLRWRLIPE